MKNKYASLFNENMNTGELRTVLFLTAEQLKSDEEKRELIEAYKPINRIVLKKQMEEAAKQGIMTSY